MTHTSESGAGRARLGMGFGEFWGHRSEAHAMALLALGFVAGWIAVGITMTGMPWLLALVASFVVAAVGLAAYGLSCLFIVGFVPLILAILITVGLEAWWRVCTNRPYVPPPQAPVVHVPTPPPAPAPQKKRGGWLIPLAIGLWIGSTWGDD